MTVSYNFDALTSTWMGGIRILLRWKGSIWKRVYKELIFWFVIYALINVAINMCSAFHKDIFTVIRGEVRKGCVGLPHIFILGFFMNVVFNRWVNIFAKIGFVDHFALVIESNIRGSDIETRILRRTLVRYLVLAQTLIFRDISIPVKKRFPNLASIVDAGLMTDDELCIFESKDVDRYYMPFQWSLRLINQARLKEKILSDVIAFHMTTKLREFRDTISHLLIYDWIPVPIAYPQIIFIAVRIYLCMLMIGRQVLEGETAIQTDDKYLKQLFQFPVMTFVEVFLLVGWTKVAESMLNPFGDNDDDYDCSYIIDRNLSTGYAIVDAVEYPPSNQDPFWNIPSPNPFDIVSKRPSLKSQPYHGSVADLVVKNDKSSLSRISTLRRRSINKRISMASQQEPSVYVVDGDYRKSAAPIPLSQRKIPILNDDAYFNTLRTRLDSVTEESSRNNSLNEASKASDISES
ncbi:unnamed protein product [Bursaphelenchus okinawaensis]|uniref:Bestrophin homolog n=1 Tax=Bursaphelenchus okinawaensis TaxID=465554 RepID=A0A811KUG6_9BILA|nr:unnamed protein product [Bursaphelenchus okinawaensis]CAG9113443.1 unnamed protein product [Bursaphelenchus okinawaensis]